MYRQDIRIAQTRFVKEVERKLSAGVMSTERFVFPTKILAEGNSFQQIFVSLDIIVIFGLLRIINWLRVRFLFLEIFSFLH